MDVQDSVARFDPQELTLGDWQDLKHAGITVSQEMDLSDPDTMIAVMKCVIRHAVPELNGKAFDDPELVAAARDVKIVEVYGDDDGDAAESEAEEEDPTSPGSRPGPAAAKKPKPRKAKGKGSV